MKMKSDAVLLPQPDLFANPQPSAPPAPMESFQLARAGDPSTSHQAAAAAAEPKKLRERQQVVLDHFTAAGSKGLTDLDLQELCGDHGSTFRTRRSELVRAGLIIDSGRKQKQLGANRIVWMIARRP